jgi:2-polyprenyl-6-methoxyphenol hydroxylase-like FAD-dependent oxidoreductase
MDVDVLIIGAGPTGLVAAIDALRHGLSVRIIDQNPQRSPHSKALVLHSRSLEVLDDLGCVEPVLRAGREFRALNILAGTRPVGRIEFRKLSWNDAPYPMWLTIPQSETERCLEERLNALGVTVERQTALRSLQQRQDGVDADLVRTDGSAETCRAAWLVGCDGARSDVRRALGVALEGDTSGEVFVLADVAMESPLVDGEGYNVLAREGRAVHRPDAEAGAGAADRASAECRAPTMPPRHRPAAAPAARRHPDRPGDDAVVARLDVGVLSEALHRDRCASGGPSWRATRRTSTRPWAARASTPAFRTRYNLMWKLALVHRGLAAPTLLDTYQEERHPVGRTDDPRGAARDLGLTLRGAPAPAVRRTRRGAASLRAGA